MDHITPEFIEEQIAYESYFTAAEGAHDAYAPPELNTLTFCVLTLCNGYTVTGESACVNPARFDKQKGRSIAREKAISKCWNLYGFLLTEYRYQEKQL